MILWAFNQVDENIGDQQDMKKGLVSIVAGRMEGR